MKRKLKEDIQPKINKKTLEGNGKKRKRKRKHPVQEKINKKRRDIKKVIKRNKQNGIKKKQRRGY